MAGGAHPATQPADDGRRLVRAEVDPTPLVDALEERREFPAVAPARDGRADGEEVAQDPAERIQVGGRVDERRRDRPGHRGEHRRRRVFDDDRAAGLLDMPRAGRSVAAAAGEDHRREARPESRRRRLEEEVDRRRDATRLGGAETQLARHDLDEPVGWDDEDDPVLEGRGLLDDLDRQRGVARQDLAEMARPAGVQVLGDDDRGREVRWEACDDPGEGFDPARGGPDDYKLRFC